MSYSTCNSFCVQYITNLRLTTSFCYFHQSYVHMYNLCAYDVFCSRWPCEWCSSIFDKVNRCNHILLGHNAVSLWSGLLAMAGGLAALFFAFKIHVAPARVIGNSRDLSWSLACKSPRWLRQSHVDIEYVRCRIPLRLIYLWEWWRSHLLIIGRDSTLAYCSFCSCSIDECIEYSPLWTHRWKL
jgi:hypothetical protein